MLIKEAKELSNGIFWFIDDEILAFPFYSDSYVDGIAKSGDTYNHKKLWNYVKPKGCNKPYNYYHRGRVEINRDKIMVYMNPNIDDIGSIKREFGIIKEPKIIYDYSNHYKCYLDDGWKPEK